jgi:4a-hydroxytetrahydrobiopterin dehydratase
MLTLNDLKNRKSHPSDQALTSGEIDQYLHLFNGWSLQDGQIQKKFSFENYYQTMAFVNALAYVAHTEDHHPDLLVSYNSCTVKFSTHSVNAGRGGISENDFICAAKIDSLKGLQ